MPDALITAAIGTIGVLIGGALQYYVGRRLETKKHFQVLRSAAYVDFLSAVAKIAQSEGQHDAARYLLTEAKVRITVYGSKEVVEAISRFEETDQILGSRDTNTAFARLVHAMRADSGVGYVKLEDVRQILLRE